MSGIRSYDGVEPSVSASVWIDPAAVVIGHVEIGPGSSIWPMTVVRGDINTIRIGARSNIQDGCVLHVSHDSPMVPGGHALVVEDDVTVGHKATLHGCTIGHHCLIGMGAIVMDGAVLEPYTILAAGSLVPEGKVLQGGMLWRGSPARMVRQLTSQELAYLDYVAGYYVKVAARYLAGK